MRFLFPLFFLLSLSTAQAEEYPHVPGQIIVKFRKIPSKLASSFSTQSFTEFPSAVSARRLYSNITQRTAQTSDLHGTFLLQFSTDSNTQDLLNTLKAHPDIEYAEPNYLLKPFIVPNDTNFTSQWWHRNTGQAGGTVGADMKSTAAWTVSTGTNTMLVAVIDTGVRMTHEDLSSNIWINDDPINGADDDGNSKIDDLNGWDFGANDNNPSDADGHGTSVAGVIAAHGNNGGGVAGVLWRAAIMVLKVQTSAGQLPLSAVTEAIVYAADNNAKIINISLGGPDSSSEEAAIDYAVNKGLLIVAAAGNENTSETGNSFPAAYSKVIAVGATNRNDQRASFSNYGSWVDVSAPGVDILSTDSTLDSSYSSGDGTSFASPIVAGIAGLIWTRFPTLTASEVRARIEDSCDSIDAGNPGFALQLGRGRVNAAKALKPPVPSGLAAAGTDVSSITWSWTAATGATGYRTFTGTNTTLLASPSTALWTRLGLATNTAYGIRIAAFNEGGESGLSSTVTTYTLAAPPTGFAMTQVFITSASFSWGANGNPTGTVYRVDRWTTGSSTTSITGTSALASLTGLEHSTTYFFQVRALNGDSVASTASSAVTLSTVTGVLLPLNSSFTPGQAATLIFNQPAGEARLQLPAGAFGEAVNITIDKPASFQAPTAPSVQLTGTGVGLDITLDKDLQPSQAAAITLEYRDSDVAGLQERRLIVARYDTAAGVWIPLPTTVDASNNKVTALTNHFSRFQIMAAAASSALASVKIFPNPFRPSLSQTRVSMTQMPADSEVELFTLVGEKILTTKANGAGMAFWEGRNDYGEPAASGIYLILIRTPVGEKEVFKLGLER